METGMARVLYVEDDATHRKFHVDAFKAAGHEVTACIDYPSAQVALKAALESNKPYDIIVSDGQYPGDGKRFTAGTHHKYQGSACLLHDHKILRLTAPVVVLSGAPEFLEQNPYPAHCTRPLHILHKLDIRPREVAANIPAYIAEGMAPRG